MKDRIKKTRFQADPTAVAPKTFGSDIDILGKSPKRFLKEGAKTSPTRGMRERFEEELRDIRRDLSWAFARTIHQRQVDHDNQEHPFMPARSVWLLVGVDENWVIRDEVAVKCVDTTGDITRARIQQEVDINRELQRTQCVHILPFIGDGIKGKDLRIEGVTNNQFECRYIFIGYCRARDLEAQIRRCERLGERAKIPEHYIWYILRNVIAALSALERGVCRDVSAVRAERQERWRGVVHCDIKPGNIFLGDEDQVYASYPRALLADFDVSKFADDVEAAEPGDPEMWEVGTSFYKPPVRNDRFLSNQLD